MKPSRYNIYLDSNDRYYVFNQLSSDFREVDSELYDALTHNSIDEEQLCGNELAELQDSQIICDDELVEENIILHANRQFRFSQGVARVTIIPTLECNFRCWYCYETHNEGRMSTQEIEATVSFCKKIIDTGIIKQFILDWFGGEPLLYFDEIVYPISMDIRNYCKDKNVFFQNLITTNGFLLSEHHIKQLINIKLCTYQITLDGAKKYHDRTRYSENRSGSYENSRKYHNAMSEYPIGKYYIKNKLYPI